MAWVCRECGFSNPDADIYCRQCSETRVDSAESLTRDRDGARSGPWLATVMIVMLVLCCLCVVGLALLDELMPTHPWRALVMGSPTPTATQPATPTFSPTVPAVVTPTYTPTPVEGWDAYEPDDAPRLAQPIETDGTAQTHRLHPPGDRDYVSFRVMAGTEYIVETGHLGVDCDTILTLYDEDGTQLTQDDDSGEESLASRVSWTAQEGGELLAEVRQFDEETAGEDTFYDIWVSESPLVVLEGDEYEPDDAMAQANELVLDIPQTHSLHAQGDQDWLFFETQEGTTYIVETLDLKGGIDTIIYLHDEDGEELARNDDRGEEGLASRIIWTADSTGVLHVVIRDFSEQRVEAGMEYTVSLTLSESPEMDIYEPDDRQDQASEIEVGSYQDHNLHVTGDRDWVCFEVLADTDYVIETFNLGDRIDTHITLYDADGNQLAEDDDSGGERLASLLTWTARETGNLCLLIRDLEDQGAEPGTEYSISVSLEGISVLSPDRYEPDGSLTLAGPIQTGDVQEHNIHVEGDHDWLSFQAQEGRTYVVETYQLGEEMDTILFLYDETGQELAQDDDGGEEPRASSLTWTAQETGTLFVMIRDYKDDRAGRDMTYDVSVYEDVRVELGASGIYVADGAYHFVTTARAPLAVGVSQLLSLESFSLEVDAAQVGGEDDNEYGLICGYQDDDNYYEVAISGDGFVGFFAKEHGRWQTISAFRPSEAINRGNAVNQLRLEVDEGSFEFYVNDQLALQEFDLRFGEGLIGFGCGSFAQTGVHCTFDNLRVSDEEGILVWEDSFDDNTGDWYQSPAR
jgi:hypothetical protein